MVGRDVVLRVEKAAGREARRHGALGQRAARVDERGRGGPRRHVAVRAGEVVGVAGVDGNGQSELVDAITGLAKIERGKVRCGPSRFKEAGPRGILDAGVGHIPEDRQQRGLVLEFSIAENIALHDSAGRLTHGGVGCSPSGWPNARGA